MKQEDTKIADGFSATGEWVTIRIEYYTEENIAKCYVNGVFTGEDDTFFDANSESRKFGTVKISMTSSTEIDYYIDNVTVTTIDKDYVRG